MPPIVELASCAVILSLLTGALPAAAAPQSTANAKISEVYDQLPLSFEANEGQVDRAVRFLCRGQGYTLFLTPTDAVLSLRTQRHVTAVVGLRLAGGNRSPRMVGESPQATKSNYFFGNDPRQFHTGVAHYAKVRIEGVYPGVDLVYRGNPRQLEYDFVVAPGADPGRIRLAWSGTDPISIGAQGELILQTPSGDWVQPPPTVYQEARTQRQRVDGHYVLLPLPAVKGRGEGARRQVGFVVGRYDRARPLVIDPVLVYSTFLGRSGDDSATGIALDGAGNAYVTGITTSTSFPGVSGSSIQPANGGGAADAFVTKINATGTAILYSTFLGGSGDDEPAGIGIDDAGNAYVAGSTDSPTFPGVSGSSIQPNNRGRNDAFVTKLNATGSAIVYSTFLGGSQDDNANGIAVDGAGNAYVTGLSHSASFPGVNGSSIQPTSSGASAFVTKINPLGTAIVYSTFLGGSNADGAVAIAVDGAGNAYVAGIAFSSDFPGVSGSSIQSINAGGGDAFVTKINAAGTAIVYSTFLGGSGFDVANSIAVDGAGSAYVTGQTFSATFPGVNPSSLQQAYGGSGDAFVTKINAAGTAIVYSTFLGGRGDDQAWGIAVDGAGNAYVTGNTQSTTFPGVNGGSIQPRNGGGIGDAFVTKIDATATAIVYSTFLGASGDDEANHIAVDGAGNAYVVGFSNSTSFPGVSGSSLQPANGGGYDAFVTKIGTDAAATGCTPSSTALCLNNGRFRVDATFDTGQQSGQAQAVALTSDTGYLWFFASSSVEAVVKVLNGCGLGGHYWVFAGGLTNVRVLMTVTDTQTRIVKTYANPPNTAFQPIQDTSAFATCP
jgi:Beta-propeller repeat